jgi:hypothetical protein
MRAECKEDQLQSIAVRKRKAADRYADNVRKKAKHAAKRDRAETVLCTSLVTCVSSLEVQLRARSNSSAARVAFLKDQFHARVSGENPRQYTGIGKEFRSKFGKLKMTPNDVTTSKEKYLHELVTAMIKEDEAMIDNPNTMPHFTEHYIRVLPTLSSDFTNPVASELKTEFAKHIAEIATPQDDPVYVELQCEYVGQILYDFETRANTKLFRVVSIQFVRSFSAARCSCWEATCEPVVRDPKTGQFRVPNDVQVPGSNVTLTNALQGYCLAEYNNGLDAQPTFLPWVKNYIDHFTTVVKPKFSNLGLDVPSTPKDSPSSKQDCPFSPMDLPTSRRTRPQTRTRRNVPEETAASD